MTMKQGVIIFAFGFVIYIRSAVATTLETVWLKDVTTNFLTEKRTLSDTDLPNELAFHLTRRSETLFLHLRRNHDINPNPDFYFAKKLQNGQYVLVKSRNIEKEDVAYYQDIKNSAFVTVRCDKKSIERCNRIITGNVRILDRDYELQPAEADVASRNSLKDPGLLGRKYVLRDQTYTQRECSVSKKDAAQGNEKNMTHKRMSLLERFQEQHKEKNFSATVATLSSRNVSTLHTRLGTGKWWELPKFYFVKVAVLIDSGLWDLYYSTVHTYTPLTRRRNVKRKIKQFYSHIMKGVNMLFKGIEDTSIRISIMLSEFIIFKKKGEFPHHASRVAPYNGIDYIDSDPYLNDLVEWDNETAATHQTFFSHGMLFTRYKLYHEDLSEPECAGLTYTGEVCNVGKRMSVVERRGYVRTVEVAAHELGHSLGACHDGEEQAIECDSEDKFIMSPDVDVDYPGKPYSKNRWLFSNCSVNSFKVTLKNKECVKNHGQYYNYMEYQKHIMKEPGEVFSVNEQCELTVGRRSALCETALEDICLLMRCTDPETGICIDDYHGAARGTECGIDKWCIDGLCVPKP